MENEDIFVFHRSDIDPQFALIWKELQSSDNYLQLCDIRLECSDGYWCNAHQSLLKVTSQWFRDAIDRLYQISGQNNEEIVISMPSYVTSQELVSIINFIYTGLVYVSETRVNQFLRVSRFLKIKGLKDIVLVFEEK
jgi:hypothetical protein